MDLKLFSKKKPKTPSQPAPAPEFTQLNNRLSLLEEKTNNLNTKLEVLEKNMIENFRKINSDIKTFDSELMGLKHQLNQTKEKMDLIIKELKMTAGKDDLNTIQKYLDLWNLAKFVTHDEVEKIIQEKFTEKNL